MRAVTPLDRSLVESFLRRRFDPSDVAALSGGTWSQAFVISARGERLVVRFGGERVEYEKDLLAGT